MSGQESELLMIFTIHDLVFIGMDLKFPLPSNMMALLLIKSLVPIGTIVIQVPSKIIFMMLSRGHPLYTPEASLLLMDKSASSFFLMSPRL
eukprot:11233813-Ditylum_brightwellii.AAC.1